MSSEDLNRRYWKRIGTAVRALRPKNLIVLVGLVREVVALIRSLASSS